MRIVEWFGGIGAFTHALSKLGKEHEIVDYVEIDKHAVKAYNAINGTNFKPTDIKDVDTSKYPIDIDVLVAGWPCTDYSQAGKRLGTFEGNHSSLILITINKLKEMMDKPKFILLENVKGLLSEKFEGDLSFIKNEFEELGYQWNQVLLNAKNFGVPQNRERVYMLLVRKDIVLTRDADKQVDMSILEDIKIHNPLWTIIDFDAPANKIILTPENHSQSENFVALANKDGVVTNHSFNRYWKVDKYCGTIACAGIPNIIYKEFNNFITLPRASDGKLINGIYNRYWKIDGHCGSLTAMNTPSIIYATNEMDNYKGKTIKIDTEKFKKEEQEIIRVAELGEMVDGKWVPHSFVQKKDFLSVNGTSKCLRAGDCDNENKIMYENGNEYCYRKLTAKECWRLMAFTDEAYEKVAKFTSPSQLCKQAGNSIVVDVLQYIIEYCIVI